MSVSGAFLRCTINGTRVGVLHSWQADDAGSDKLDRTSGDDDGFTNRDIGCLDLVVSLGIYFDTTTGTNLTFSTGAVISNVLLYFNSGDATPAFNIPLALVMSNPKTVEVRGRCETTFQIGNKGPYNRNNF
jgi:hypothetical protein